MDPTPTTSTALSDQADAELEDATRSLDAGDDGAGRNVLDIRKALASVNRESRLALAEAKRLHADDVSNPAGIARQLAEIPGKLRASTSIALEQAEIALDVLEGRHLTAILRHDDRRDANLIVEIGNYVAGMNQQNAYERLVALAADTRYSTFMAGPMGKSLAARFGFDAAVLTKVALRALGEHGTEDQRRRAAAVAAIPAARRVLALAKAGRDNVAAETQRVPAKPSGAGLMG